MMAALGRTVSDSDWTISGGTASPELAAVPVVIVGFRNPADVNACLCALGRMDQTPPLAVFVCENGGSQAFDELVATLIGAEGSCCHRDLAAPDELSPIFFGQSFIRMARLQIRAGNGVVRVYVGEAPDNLGFAGGVNAYLRPLLTTRGWPGVWILNPDTEPAPDALKELVQYARCNNRDMVGSRLVPRDAPDLIQTRGLAWRRWRGASTLLDPRSPVALCMPSDQMDARLDSPSGASMYVTRDCIERVGLMDERYFLYFEDLDWGLRVKREGRLGYADRSVVVHDGGTTIGGARSRHLHSPLAIYLYFRNRLLFVRSHDAGWLPWTTFMEVVEILDLARRCAFRNMAMAARGMAAGLIGRDGRPDHRIQSDRAPARAQAR